MDDIITRQAVLNTVEKLYKACEGNASDYHDLLVACFTDLTPAQPQPEIKRCKDCKHWRDSDGVYRRGTGAESKCPLNTKEVYAGTFYCGYAERRTDERTD